MGLIIPGKAPGMLPQKTKRLPDEQPFSLFKSNF